MLKSPQNVFLPEWGSLADTPEFGKLTARIDLYKASVREEVAAMIEAGDLYLPSVEDINTQ